MKQLTLTITIGAPIKTVWKTLIDPSLWWSDVSLEPKEGGLFEEKWGDTTTQGVITTFEPLKKLELSWQDEDWPGATKVRFLLTADGNQTTVALEHSGWEIFSADIATQLISAHKTGWESHLQDLAKAAKK